MPVLSFADAQKYAVNRASEYEVTRQTLYDFQTYDGASGQTSLTFFQTPIGQSGKTVADTNMEVAGMLAQPKNFLVMSIEILFYPGVLPVIATHNAASIASAASNFANDVYTVAKSGSLAFFIGSKNYLQEAPIGRFPAKTKLDSEFAASIEYTQAIAADKEEQVVMDYASFSGRPYFLDPYNILLAPTQNFSITLTWPTAVVLPSGQDARIGVVLDGILYKLSQ